MCGQPNSNQALLQALHENIFRQIDTDEDHFAGFLLTLSPSRAKVAAHQLVYALKDHLALSAFHIQHAFVAQHARALDIDNRTQEIFEFCRAERLVGAKNKAFDVVVMHMVMTVFSRMGGMVAVLAVLMIMV